MEQLLQHLGGMVQQALREQVTPKLQEMMAQQSMVSVRFDQLERASRSASLDGELLAERASLLDLSGPQSSEPLRAVAVDSVADNHALSRSVHSTAQQTTQVRATPNPEEGRLQRLGGKSEAQSSGGNGMGDPIQPKEQCGWRDAGGLSLVPGLTALADPRPGFSHMRNEGYPAGRFSFRGLGSERPVSPADMFRERAPSPFQRHPAARSRQLGQDGAWTSRRAA